MVAVAGSSPAPSGAETGNKDDLDYREILQHQTPEQRRLQRLEWRWQRKMLKWEKAALRVQSCYRGSKDRRRVEKARAARAPLLRSIELCEEASDAAAHGDYSLTLELVTRSIEEEDGEYGPAYTLRGRLRMVEGNLQGALEDLDEALKDHGGDENHAEGSVSIMSISASLLSKQKKRQEVVAALKARARAHARLQQWQKALKDLSRAVRLDPDDVDLYLLRGNISLKAHKYKDAVFDFTRILDRTDAPSVEDYLRRACGHVCSQDWRAAEVDCSTAIARSRRKSPKAFTMRGRVLACMRRWKHALLDYEEALKLQPDYAPALQAKEEALLPDLPLPMLDAASAERVLNNK